MTLEVAVVEIGVWCSPSRVMPGLRGTPAGIRTISLPERHSARADGVGSNPLTFCISAQTLLYKHPNKSYLALGVDVTDIRSNA